MNSKRARLIRKQAVELANRTGQPERWKELYRRAKNHYSRTGEMIYDVARRVMK